MLPDFLTVAVYVVVVLSIKIMIEFGECESRLLIS